jgi:hypothetical protein
MDLLVSYPWNHFSLARNDVMHTLHEFGDINSELERTKQGHQAHLKLFGYAVEPMSWTIFYFSIAV